MSLKDQDGQFSAMSALIRQQIPESALLSHLPMFLEDDKLSEKLPAVSNLPIDYAIHLSHSKLVRIQKNEFDASILANNHVFFTFSKNRAVLQGVRLASAFFWERTVCR